MVRVWVRRSLRRVSVRIAVRLGILTTITVMLKAHIVRNLAVSTRSVKGGYTMLLEEYIITFSAGAALGWIMVGLFFWAKDKLEAYLNDPKHD